MFVNGIGTLPLDKLTQFFVARHKLDMEVKQKNI